MYGSTHPQTSTNEHHKMTDKNMMTDDKFPIQEDVVRVEAEVWDEDKKKLDKRVNRKLDCHILPWLIVS